MKNFIKNISKWSSSMKLGTAIALGGLILLGTSILYANGTSTATTTTSTKPTISITVDPVVDEKIEEVIRPYTANCEIGHYFYDEDDASEIREKAIVNVPGANRTYMLSEGCDYVYSGSFDVIAVVSGTITDKISDPTFGEVVILTHENGTKFIYSSLTSPKVNKGQNVKQGEVIAKSGTSVYTSSFENALHFEVVKNDKHLNPEKIYTTSVENL
jgi:stage II sporulation protein Q